MFVFGFKKNGFTVPFLGLKPFQMAYVCRGGGNPTSPRFPPPPAPPLLFARVLREHVIVCITLIGEGGRAAAPPRRSGMGYITPTFSVGRLRLPVWLHAAQAPAAYSSQTPLEPVPPGYI